MLGGLRFRRCILLCAAVLTFGAGLFAGTSGSEADAVPTISPVLYHVASLSPATTASLPAFTPLNPIEQTAEPFGTGTSKLTSGGMVEKWRNVTNSLRLEQRVLELCRRNVEICEPAARRFLAVIELGRNAQGRARIGLINRAVNLSIRPVSDMVQYGVEDVWATPLMTFSSGTGDCEDYAIAKYVALREAGIAESDLRLVVVRDNAVHEYHAVTAVRDNGRWLILDNRTLAIRDDSAIAEFNPLFAMSDTGVRRIQAMARPRKPAAEIAASTSGGSELPLLM